MFEQRATDFWKQANPDWSHDDLELVPYHENPEILKIEGFEFSQKQVEKFKTQIESQ